VLVRGTQQRQVLARRLPTLTHVRLRSCLVRATGRRSHVSHLRAAVAAAVPALRLQFPRPASATNTPPTSVEYWCHQAKYCPSENVGQRLGLQSVGGRESLEERHRAVEFDSVRGEALGQGLVQVGEAVGGVVEDALSVE
jgi:hypothetical protein